LAGFFLPINVMWKTSILRLKDDRNVLNFMYNFPFLTILLFSIVPAKGQFFDQTNKFLLENVNAGKVDYNKLKRDSTDLKILINMIKNERLDNQTDNYKLAFYINSYNLLVIHQITSRYPVSSPMDITGFFKQNKFVVAGEQLTLDELEFDKLTNEYKDPRIHFALGCAALSCPFLYDNAFTPEHVEEQLKFRAQLIIDRPNYIEVDEKNKIIFMNKIFEWYQGQFSFNAGSLINFVNKYRFYKVPHDYEIKFIEYDWSLNDDNLAKG